MLPLRIVETIHCRRYEPDYIPPEDLGSPNNPNDHLRNRQAIEGRPGEVEYNRFDHLPGTHSPQSAREYQGGQGQRAVRRQAAPSRQNNSQVSSSPIINPVPIEQVPLRGGSNSGETDEFYVGPGD